MPTTSSGSPPVAPGSATQTPGPEIEVRDRFSHRTYIADFGSYEGNRRTEEPDNELLVGRESQRARLLDLLLNTAQRGAYLITGHRGSGKTTFVNYCLNEYRFEIFYRFLKSNLGRAFLWDRFGLVAFGVLVFLMGILLHQTLAYMVLDGELENVVHWLAFGVLTLIAVHPVVAAYERFQLLADRLAEIARLRCQKHASSSATDASGPSDPWPARAYRWVKRASSRLFQFVVGGQQPSFRPLVALVGVAGFLWFQVPASHPSQSVAELIYAIGWMFLFITLAHETFPRAQEFHIGPLIGLGLLDLWATNRYLEGLPLQHPTVGLFASGLLAGSVGLLLTAYHKHGAVQRWFRAHTDELPAKLLRTSPLDSVPFLWIDARGANRPALSRSSLMALWTLILASAFGIASLLYESLRTLEGATPWLPWLLLLAFFPVLVDLVLLHLTGAEPSERDDLRDTELTQTAFATLDSARWQVKTALVTLGGVWLLSFYLSIERAAVLLTSIKLLVALVAFFAVYLGLRLLHWGAVASKALPEPQASDGASHPPWRSRSRFRTRADGNDTRQELLQAAISGQHAQPFLLVFAKAVILLSIGLLLAYPSLSFVQRIIEDTAEPAAETATEIAAETGSDQLSASKQSTRGEAGRRAPLTLAEQARSGVVDLFADIDRIVPPRATSRYGVPAGQIAEAESKARDRIKLSISWLVGLAILTLAISYLEYEWIVRGGQHVRPDRTLRHQTSEVRNPVADDEDGSGRVSRAYQRRLLEQTIFWRVHQAWLPILVVPVNLGFDSLDHRRVVEAMLTGLRDSYRTLFFEWKSPMRLVLRGGALVLAFWLTMSLGDSWFCIHPEQMDVVQRGRYCEQVAPKDGALGATGAPPGMQLACLFGEIGARTVQWELMQGREAERDPYMANSRLLVAKYEGTVFATFFPEIQKHGNVSIRLYHLGLFFAILFLGGWLMRRGGLLPYRKALDEIELLLGRISSRQHEETRQQTALVPRIVNFFVGDEPVQHWEADPFDPRTIEISVLRVLREIQDPTVQFPYLARHRVNLPTPEVIFKFDELDKLGIGVLPQRDTAGPEVGTSEHFDLERQRSRALHSLFADMKNLVSSDAARFLFIGGRNLHDEWLADQTARRPLLTNIFEVEIYLPSLLLGEGPADSNAEDLTDGILAFVEAQYRHAVARNRRSLLHRYRPWLTPWLESPSDPIFVQESWETLKRPLSPTFNIRAVPLATFQLGTGGSRQSARPERSWGVRSLPHWEMALASDFIEFLAYRSRGNVKRLKATLERFIEPSLKVLGKDLPVDCQHLLVFRDTDRFRIQLIAEIYRRILGAFDPRIRFYDDKLVVGLLYVADFLLKFHRRAFAWSSLQKVDELVHIHRAPELPNAVADLLGAWQQKYLHPIRNGMYDYRFHSDFATELQYLSRRSDEELAALNFTLDESQSLKAIYRSRFSELEDPAAYEFVAVLGELHELDGEHDVARYYYNRALTYLDQHFHAQVARKKDVPAVYSVLGQKNEGLDAARRRIAWGMTRLRLKMHVGMSYEQANDLEQAQAHYRNARTFASALVRAMLNASTREDEASTAQSSKGKKGKKGKKSQRTGRNGHDGVAQIFFPRSPDYGYPDYASTLKHLDLVFQPAFAEAWVSEKHQEGVDTSARLIERSVWELRWKLPFVREVFDPENVLRLCPDWVPDHDVLHPNFALVVAEQHDKVGDLLFYKGGVGFDLPDEPASPPRRRAGYLVRSRYHYTVSLHELRNFNRARRMRWPDNYGGTVPPVEEPLAAGEWADFAFRAIAGTLADYSETFLAMVPSVGVLPASETGLDEEAAIPDPLPASRRGGLVGCLNLAATLVGPGRRDSAAGTGGLRTERRRTERRRRLDLLAEIVQAWLAGHGSLSSELAEKFDDLAGCDPQSHDAASLPPEVFGAWMVETLFGAPSHRESEPPGAELGPWLSHPSADEAEGWFVPFEKALAPWLGIAADRPELLDKLDPGFRGQDASSIRATLEENMRNPETADGDRSSSPVGPDDRWHPSTPGELRDLADDRVRDLVVFEARAEPREALATYFVMGWSASKILRAGGFYEDAGRECQRLAETVGHLLRAARIASWSCLPKAVEGKSGADGGCPWKAAYGQPKGRPDRRRLADLLDMGLLLLQEADALYSRSRNEWRTRDGCQVGTRVPTQLAILAAALGLAELDLRVGTTDPTRRNLCAVEELLHDWCRGHHACSPQTPHPSTLPDSPGPPAAHEPDRDHRAWLRNRVITILERNAYPLMGRLSALQLLVDDALLGAADSSVPGASSNVDCHTETCHHLSELIQLEDLYDGRWHFTPFQIGSTLALWALQPRPRLAEIDHAITAKQALDQSEGRRHDRLLPESAELRQMARRRLIQGQEMYTMRRTYYRSIRRLFYLHDDFNDRRIHYNHAVQMMSAELSRLLVASLDAEIDQDRA